MKKFMKFCFIAAMLLIIVGGAFYLLGKKDGKQEMEELLTELGGDWMDLGGWRSDAEDIGWSWTDWGSGAEDIVDRAGSYSINEASIFDEDHEVMSGDLTRYVVSRYSGGDSITDVQLEIGGSMVEVLVSDDDNAYIDSRNVGSLQAYIEAGVLYVRSVRPASLMNEIKNSTLTLYLPTSSLERLDISLGAGQLTLENLVVQDMTADIGAGQLVLEDLALGTLAVELGAGELVAENVGVEELAASIGAGNMEFTGDIYGSAQISCAMGNVSMELEGDAKDFDYQLSCVAGNIEIDGDSFSGAAIDRFIDNDAARTMDIDCSMGNVEIDF